MRAKMILTDEQHKEFEAVAKPMIKWLCENCHPHVTVVVTPVSAELSEGTCAITTHEFVRD